MQNALILKELISHLKMSVRSFERAIGVSDTRIDKAMARNSKLNYDIVERIVQTFPQVSRKWLIEGEPPIIMPLFESNVKMVADHQSTERYTNKAGNTFIETPGGKMMLVTKLITHKAQAGYLRGWGDGEFIEGQPDHYVVVNEAHKGFYLSFEADGDSMDDGSKQSISDGDIVTGRRIPRHLWEKSKLHTHRYADYIIHHQADGLCIKRIIEHNVEAGTIVCHSLNPDKEHYPDFTMNLEEVSQIFNIINVSHPR